ncbi:hypothetical protein Q3G72_025994 [Acer saccharum]|nr:hypothetical protein Q3G72_025994 [Acer saccharum]
MSYCTLTVAGHSIYPPNPISIPDSSSHRKQTISLLQKCKNINQIQSIHAKIIRNGHEHDPFIVFELIRLSSSKFNSIDYACKVFHHTHNQNVYLYTSLIDGFVFSRSYVDAVRLYCQMISESILPDNYVITSVLKACGSLLALREGREVHGQVLKLGLSSNRSIRLKLMEFYGKCCEFKDAIQVFDEMPDCDVVASTVVITCYFDHGLVERAIDLFNRVKTKDTVCWTAMIDGLVRNGEMSRALDVFREMQSEIVRPNEVTIVCVLSACSQMGALELGRWVHSYVGKYQIELNHFVGGALINMYSRNSKLCYTYLNEEKQRPERERRRSEHHQSHLYDNTHPMDFKDFVEGDYGVISDSAEMEAADDVDSKIKENNTVGRDICMPEGGEMIDFYDGRELIVNEINGSVEPYVGMEFDSEEAAMVYYDLYAKRVGFIIRVGNCHRSNRGGPIVSRRFLCNKEGFRVNNRKTKSLEVRKPREVTREGCKAMIMVRKEKSGKWVVAKVETEHSHPLGIPSGKGRRDTVQARPQDEKDKKIRELSLELNRANQQLSKCRGQLDMVLKDIERHTDHLTNSIQNIIKNVREVEAEDLDQ